MWVQSKTAAVEVDSAFPGGNVAVPRLLSPGHLQFAAAAHGSPRPLWFYFRVRGAPGPQLCCELMNAEDCLGPASGWSNARPVYSPDGKQWRRVERGDYHPARGSFRFQVPVAGEAVWIAYCYPYTGADLERFLASLSSPPAVSELCRSESGRPVPYVRLGNQDDPRRVIWILARQHAGESPASFTVEGLLECLDRATGPVEALLRETAFHVVPMVDVDSVEEGRFGKDHDPVDFNRDWGPTPVRPAIRALIAQIRASRVQARIALALDLHAPHHGDPACYFFAAAAEHPGRVSAADSRFLDLLAEEAPEGVGFRPTDHRVSPPPPGSARQFFSNEGAAQVLTIEMSYHQAQSGRYLEPDDYRAFGRALGPAIARLLAK